MISISLSGNPSDAIKSCTYSLQHSCVHVK